MNNEASKITIVLAHPDINDSRANKELINTVKELNNVAVYNIYEDFPALFDVETWTQIMLESSALIYQFPLHWMSAPYMLKKWQEEIFTHLSRTPMIVGKPMLVAVTVGGNENTYRSGGKNHYTIDEILRPYEACAIAAGMKWQSPIVIYDMDKEQIGKNLTQGSIEYKDRIEKLVNATQLNILADW